MSLENRLEGKSAAAGLREACACWVIEQYADCAVVMLHQGQSEVGIQGDWESNTHIGACQE